jgi:TatD DNase family protein
MVELIDIGLNLSDERFSSDWLQVIGRARDAGVRRFILTGTTIVGSFNNAILAEKLGPGCGYFTAGVHPHQSITFVADKAGQTEALRELVAHTQAVAIGETGLDYYRDLAPRNIHGTFHNVCPQCRRLRN